MNRKERRAAGDRTPVGTHPTVELAYLHPGDVSDAFMSSVIRCRDYELMRTQALFGVRSRRARSGSIAKARNEITTMFVRGTTEWLWFVDADMGFPRDALQKLLRSADKDERPLMGGLCFAHRTEGFEEETNAELFGMIPTISVWDEQEDGTVVGWKAVVDYPRDAVCQLGSTGAACVLIHRSVLEQMQAKYGDHWWTQIPHPTRNEPFGEDTSFFLRAYEMKIPVHVHTGVRTSHDKGGIFLTEQTWDDQQRLRGLDESRLPVDESEGAVSQDH
jgi:hypothetical protein